MTSEVDEAATGYNNPDFYVRVPDLSQIGDTMPLRVGSPAPDFEAQLLDGGTYRLADARDKRHVVLMMGAVTSPMCAIQIPSMNELSREYAHSVDFLLVYVKESHPGEHYPHHTSMDQKLAHARDLKSVEGPAFPILVDTLDGRIHRSYGAWPTSLFVIHHNGRLVYRSTIADPSNLRAYLTELDEWDKLHEENPGHLPHTSYTEFLVEHRVNEPVHHRVYERAGPKAFEDFWRVYPNLRDKWPIDRTETEGRTGPQNLS
jgi:hypothetical protein